MHRALVPTTRRGVVSCQFDLHICCYFIISCYHVREYVRASIHFHNDTVLINISNN